LRNNGVTAGTYGDFNQNVRLTVDATGRVTSIANANGTLNYPVFYKGAIAQGTNAVLGFSFSDTEAPNAAIYDGVNGSVYAVAQFTEGNAYSVQDHFWLPDDWVGDVISLDIYWRSAAATGTVTWDIQMGSVRAGLSADVVFNSVKAVTTTVPATPFHTVRSRITPLSMSGIMAGDEVFFTFSRDAGDTSDDVAELISLKFNINRNFALVQ
jgi:hypothetical protein